MRREREFDYGNLTYQNRSDIHDSLAETTVKHIDRGAGLFSPMPFDPAQSPSQRLEVVHLDPAPSTIDEIHGLADIANGPLAEVTRAELAKQSAYVKAAKFMLERGDNITFATTHGNIADVAIWQEAWLEASDLDDWQERNGLGISRGVTTIGAFGMAASEVVQKMGHVFLSFPRTSTIEAMDIDPGLVETNNKNWRREVKQWMGSEFGHRMRKTGGKSLHLAWEGKTTKVNYGDDQKPESLVMGKVSEGTLDVIKNSIVQPIAIWEQPEPVVEIGEPTIVKNMDDVRRVQNWQRETLANIIGISTEKITFAS